MVVVVAVGVLGAGVSAFWVLTILPRSLPSVTQLESFEPSVGSKIYDENDELITEFHVERRIFMQLGHIDRKSTRLNSSHIQKSRMPSSA